MDNLPETSANPKSLLIKSGVAVLVLVTVAFVILFLVLKSQHPANDSTRLVLPSITFSNPPSGERFEQLVKLGLDSSSEDAQFDNLSKAFSILSSDYSFEPRAEKREALETLSNYLKKNFPQEAKDKDLTVPCKEQVCGAEAIYSPELSSLKADIESNARLSGLTKSTLLYNIENSAYAAGENDPKGQFYSLSTLFFNLRTFWLQSNDSAIKSLAEKVLVLMKEVDPRLFEMGLSRNQYNLDGGDDIQGE